MGRTPRPLTQAEVVIEALDQEGRGVGHRDGKVVFVEGALIGEHVTYVREKSKPNYETGSVTAVRHPSVARMAPPCPSFGVCGGCSMQHLEPRSQLAIKQRVLEDNLWHIARLRPATVYRPIQGPNWGYRHRARLSVRNVEKKGGILVGFHEKRHSWIADMTCCDVLAPEVGSLLVPLRILVAALSIKDRLPQIEVAIGGRSVVLVLRILEAITADDRRLLSEFEDRHRVQIWLQPSGPDSAQPMRATDTPLEYALPEFGVVMPFRPTDFTQVNAGINAVLVKRALSLLAPRAGERIADLFCGIGNFTLPIARRASQVVGVEGSAALVERARANARHNGLSERTEFAQADLFEFDADALARLGPLDGMLIDPPREGALAVARVLAAAPPLARVVYVSCNPATLARDAAVLVHEGPYDLVGAGVVNMFPHTSHVESIALFERRVAGDP